MAEHDRFKPLQKQPEPPETMHSDNPLLHMVGRMGPMVVTLKHDGVQVPMQHAGEPPAVHNC